MIRKFGHRRLLTVAVLFTAGLCTAHAAAQHRPPTRPPTPPTHVHAGMLGTVPWYRTPVIHTVEEQLFSIWMTHQFGPGWQKWVPDHLILLYWNHFQLANRRR